MLKKKIRAYSFHTQNSALGQKHTKQGYKKKNTYFLANKFETDTVERAFLFPRDEQEPGFESKESSHSGVDDPRFPTIFFKPVNILVNDPLRLFFFIFLLSMDVKLSSK